MEPVLPGLYSGQSPVANPLPPNIFSLGSEMRTISPLKSFQMNVVFKVNVGLRLMISRGQLIPEQIYNTLNQQYVNYEHQPNNKSRVKLGVCFLF